jgi:hypothetical protein
MTQNSNRTNYYRAFRISGGIYSGLWVGWMTYAESPNNVIQTPDRYRTKREALAAIKGQHP